jgi:TetR/AcrR family tetracycline transcriptional repressor
MTAARRRGRPPRISRDRIVEVGLGIAREQGIKGVTMTSVAARLDVATPALYHYVSGHEELLGLIGRSLLEPYHLPAGDELPWTEWLFAFAHAIRAQAVGEPTLGVVPHVSAHGLLSIPALERSVEVLTDAGFDEQDAFLHTTNIVSTVFTSVYRDHCTHQERVAGRSRIVMFLDALREYPRDEAPRLWAVADAWEEVGPDTETDPVSHFDREIRLLVAGMEAELEGRVTLDPVRLARAVDRDATPG